MDLIKLFKNISSILDRYHPTVVNLASSVLDATVISENTVDICKLFQSLNMNELYVGGNNKVSLEQLSLSNQCVHKIDSIRLDFTKFQRSNLGILESIGANLIRLRYNEKVPTQCIKIFPDEYFKLIVTINQSNIYEGRSDE